LQDVRWSIRALPLLIGRLSGRLDARLPDGFIGTDFAAGMRRVRLEELRASVPLPTLRAMLPVQGMEGMASVSLASLQLEDGWPTAVLGELKLGQLQVAPLMPTGQPGLIALGDYDVRFTDAGDDGIAAELKDTGSGPLEVSGNLRLDRERRYALDALITPRPGAPAPLVDGLKLMAEEPDAAGRRRLTLTGSL
jgi:hypothetical protein